MLFVLTVAAAESAVGLAILVIYFRVRGEISMQNINLIQGLEFFMVFLDLFRRIAQLVERVADNYDAGGSNPSTPTEKVLKGS